MGAGAAWGAMVMYLRAFTRPDNHEHMGHFI